MTRTGLERLLSPRSIAVFGASPEPTSAAAAVLANLDRFGFEGEVHLVSRTRTEVNGRPCLAAIDDLPEGVDALVVAAPKAAALEAIEAAGRRGVGGAVVFAAGFAETDAEGRSAQAALADAARGGGVALLGPNCLGMTSYAAKAPLTFEHVFPLPEAAGARVAVIAQSGAIAGNLRLGLAARGLNIVLAVSTGNEAVVGVDEVFDHLVRADGADLFVLFVEAIRRPGLFLAAAAAARRAGKPVLLMHPGRSARARAAALSHTGAMAGDHATMQAFVEREGVLLAPGLDELFDAAAILARYPRPTGGGVAVASNSGALVGVSIDMADALGMPLAELQPATVEALARALPAFAHADNPLDLTAQGLLQPELFGSTARILLDDPGVAGLVEPLMGGGPAQQNAKLDHLLPVLAPSEKPVALAFMGDEHPLDAAALGRIRAARVPFFRSPDRALRAMAAVNRYARAHEAAEPRRPSSTAPVVEPRQSGALAEYRAKAVLEALGVAVPAGGLARTPEAAAAIAERVGFPVALKAQAPALTHKTDAGGVALGLYDAEAVRDAWTRVEAAVAAAEPAVALDGMLVEAMVEPGVELIVGARSDPAWGVVLLAGLGGIWTEALHDVRLMPADLTADQVVRELERLAGARVLRGLRGAPPVDLEALAAVLGRIADLMHANPALAEMEINPLRALGDGRLTALDALLVFR
jgi:acyl-CoA synthetase (NDP forming)